MKKNYPVTEVEHLLDPAKPIVTKTDLKGIITYANQSFVDMSGYSREELLGKNHNLVRHPDMPEEAFEDLWNTLKTGSPWRGLVKNRCKNGDFYWVEAYVTPILENGKVIGYMSVRNTPNRIAIEAANTLYTAVREKKSPFPYTQTRYPLWHSLAIRQVILAIFISSLIVLSMLGMYPLLTGISALMGLGLLMLDQKRVGQKTIEDLVRSFSAIAEGNFNHNIASPSASEFVPLYTSLESMRINLRAIVADVMISTDTVSDLSKWLEKEMQDLEKWSDKQNNHVSEAITRFKAISTATHSVAENTENTAQTAQNALIVAQDSNQAMKESLKNNTHTVEVVKNAQSKLTQLNEELSQISSVTATIQSIAEQTNLLALNAAIESARAGEVGRGFAVVADEVRKLAERTSTSTIDINTMIQNLEQLSHEMVKSMRLVQQEVQTGSALIEENYTHLNELGEVVTETSSLSRQNAETLRNQKAASEDACNIMNDIACISERTGLSVAGIERVTLALLLRTTTELKLLTQHFKKSL